MTHGTLSDAIYAIEFCLFAYFVLININYLFTGTIALLRLPWIAKLHLADPVRRSNSTLDQPVTLVVPAFNEERCIIGSLRSMLALAYANFEIIVVNDGSTDASLQALDDAFELEPYGGVYRPTLDTQEVREIYQSAIYPELRVIDKANGGKGDALNAGINLARYPLIFSVDADSSYHRQALQWMVEPFQRDPRMVVVGGTIGVGDCTDNVDADRDFEHHLPKTLIKRFQVLEYLRAFLATRMGFAPLNALGIVSGACGLWRKDILLACGGFRTDTIWEDMEMTMRIHNYCISTGRPYRVGFTPYPVCWTDVPATAGSLYRQRKGWHRHLSECVSIHRRLLFGSRSFFSWITMPYFVFFEWLAPLIVLFGIAFAIVSASLGFLDVLGQLWLLALVLMLGILGSIASILLDYISFAAYRLSDLWSLLFAATLENFGYRQFVMLANLSGFGAWLFRRPINGDSKHPGPFVRAWRPESPDST
ncbi:MAG: glycosyltransferase [Candidatus Aquilonibacter sp.]|jgi:cellulose synthase/poly-beta-1,6-N-acetylglucosamine synthase-like glycosyltransferase